MEKFLAQDYGAKERIQFLKDNADAVEELGYQKPLTEDELITLKEGLTETSIKIADLNAAKSEAVRGFNDQLKPLEQERAKTIASLKARSEFRTEDCYKFVDQEEGEVGFYNADGMLVYQRQILPGERQKTVFAEMPFRKTGTNN